MRFLRSRYNLSVGDTRAFAAAFAVGVTILAQSACSGEVKAKLPPGAKLAGASLNANGMCTSWQPSRIFSDVRNLNDGSIDPHLLTDIGAMDVLQLDATATGLIDAADKPVICSVNTMSLGDKMCNTFDQDDPRRASCSAEISACRASKVADENFDLPACLRGVEGHARVYCMDPDQPDDSAALTTSTVPKFFSVSMGEVSPFPTDVEAISFAPCDFNMPEFGVIDTSTCLFAADLGEARGEAQVPKSVLIFKVPDSLDVLVQGDPLPLLSRIYIEIPGDDGGLASSGTISTDFDAFDVHPGVIVGKAARKRNAKLEDRIGHGDWYMVSRAVVGGGARQSKLLPTQMYRVAREEWSKKVFETDAAKRVIQIGPGTSNDAMGTIPLPYLVALDMKTNKVDLSKEPYVDYLKLLSETMREKVEALYNGNFNENYSVGSDVLAESEYGDEVSIRDVVNKDVWLEHGGKNPFGSMIATEFKFTGDGKSQYMQTYSQFLESKINVLEDFPDTKTMLVEALTKYHDNPNPLLQMDTLALLSEYDSDGNFLGESIFYSTETEESEDEETPAELWKLTCMELLLKKN
jgi:hypothetical protein